MEELSGWFQLISNLAVLGGLVFLAIEVRQNTNVAKVRTHTELLQIGHDTHNWKREPQFAEVVVRASETYDSLSEAEKVQFSTFVFQLLNLWEHALGVHNRGLMTDTYWEAWNDTFHPNMKDPGWRSVWGSVKPYFAAEFQRHVDQYV